MKRCGICNQEHGNKAKKCYRCNVWFNKKDADKKVNSSAYKKTSIHYLRILRKLMKDKVVSDTDIRGCMGNAGNKEGLITKMRRLRGHGFDVKWFDVKEKNKKYGVIKRRFFYLNGVLDIGDMYNERRNES